MINLAAVERDHVLTAIEQFDAIGGQAMLTAQRGERSAVVLHHNAHTYDGSVIVGLAHGLATGYTPEPAAVRTKSHQVAKALTRCGFDVLGPVGSPRPAQPRRTSSHRDRPVTQRSRVSSVREQSPVICPTCFMALPATGRCDTCL